MRCANCFEEIQHENEPCPYCRYTKGEPAIELYHLFPGTMLKERYSIGQVVGFGGFGITYKALDTKFDTVVAIKEYYPAGLVNRVPGKEDVLLFSGTRHRDYDAGLRRFLDEARNMAKFQMHPNIVNIYEYFEDNNTAYIVMEFLDGIALNEFLKYNDLDFDSCLEITHKVCSALAEIHAQKIIHRDVSPDNIFLCMNNSVKLIDFGAARFSANEEKKMTIILKPGFAPPEQYESINKQGPWTDIYALGATLYLMLTKTKPDESTNRKIADHVVPPHELNPEIPEQISNTIMKAMALDHHFRFSTIQEFVKALSGNKKVVSLVKEKKKRKIRYMFGIGAAMMAIIVSALLLIAGVLNQRADATLPNADITFWYLPREGDEERQYQAWQEIIDTFQQEYPNVTIEPVSRSTKEYAAQLAEALEANTATLFMVPSTDSSIVASYAGDISGVFSRVERESCAFLEEMRSNLVHQKQIPLSATVPVLYIHTVANNGAYGNIFGKMVEADELLRQLTSSASLSVAEVHQNMDAAFMEKLLSRAQMAPVSSFVAGKSVFHYGTTLEYLTVSRGCAGCYQVSGISEREQRGYFCDRVAVYKNATEAQKEVAEQFIAYLLSDSAQEILYVKNGNGAIPLNKNAANIFATVYDELDMCIPLEEYCIIH